ncbi:hypothetical protein DW1_1141 [Proteiniborus sp. DW1]|uniref:hypothetical protein n=1 Tax=Proteiniborus sp. DW1 TaxID=1889883 RepID=UPI00092E03DF|nr:hypothetical protein [Proteiniborus sp. DW1]SCG82714.1 hypothetical protein DW1_1141 [Proteiniborus sp. DW1]
MGLEYISYIQTEELFKAWPTIQGIKESLAIELRALEVANSDEKDEYIYTQVVGNKVITDIPPTGKISDTTGDIAANYMNVINRDYYNTLEAIKKDKFYIELVDDKLNIAFRRLTSTQQKLLKLFYWEKKTWAEVLEELKKDKHFISKHQAQVQRRVSIEKLQSISKITVEAYLKVMELVEVE